MKNNLNTLTLSQYQNVFTFPVKKYYRRVGLTEEKFDFNILAHEFIDDYEKRIEEAVLFPDTESTLKYVYQNNVNQYILSAYTQNKLENILSKYKLNTYFSRMIGSKDIYANGKTASGLALVKEINSNKKNIVLIGDTVHDFEVAQSMGIDCILVNQGHQSLDILKETNTIIVSSLSEIKNIIV